MVANEIRKLSVQSTKAAADVVGKINATSEKVNREMAEAQASIKQYDSSEGMTILVTELAAMPKQIRGQQRTASRCDLRGRSQLSRKCRPAFADAGPYPISRCHAAAARARPEGADRMSAINLQQLSEEPESPDETSPPENQLQRNSRRPGRRLSHGQSECRSSCRHRRGDNPLREAGYRTVLIRNQPGPGRFSRSSDFFKPADYLSLAVLWLFLHGSNNTVLQRY